MILMRTSQVVSSLWSPRRRYMGRYFVYIVLVKGGSDGRDARDEYS